MKLNTIDEIKIKYLQQDEINNIDDFLISVSCSLDFLMDKSTKDYERKKDAIRNLYRIMDIIKNLKNEGKDLNE